MRKSTKDTITADQLTSLAFTGLLSPLIWLIPHTAAESAGTAAVFSPLFAIPPLAVLVFLTFSFARRRTSEEGLADMIIRCLGNGLGRAVCALLILWFVFYAAVSLRTSAERFLSTIFPGGSLWVFMPITLGISVIGAAGRVRSLASSSQIFFRLIIFVLVVVFAFTLPQISRYNLLPYTYLDIPPAALGGLAVANAISPAIYVLFLAHKVKDSRINKKSILAHTGLMLVISFLMIITVIGNFGVAFTNTMQNPFFTMIRNISIFNVVERWEAVVVAMWVLTDFIFLSVLLTISKTLTRVVIPVKKDGLILGVISVAVFLLGMFMESNAFSFAKISQNICPTVNAVVVFGLLPLVWIVGFLRKKL